MDSKKPWQSKTILINALLGALSFVALFSPIGGDAQAFIQAHGAEIGIFWSMANMVLRLVTKDQIVLGD
jgi:hypothetical protein